LNTANGIFVDSNGNIYFADTNNHVVRKYTAVTAIVTTFAGTPQTPGFGGDNSTSTTQGVRLNLPRDVWMNTYGDVFIADASNNRVRVVTASNNRINTIIGTGLGKIAFLFIFLFLERSQLILSQALMLATVA
jgi:hypothetical protein